jgi:hypothetical protein
MKHHKPQPTWHVVKDSDDSLSRKLLAAFLRMARKDGRVFCVANAADTWRKPAHRRYFLPKFNALVEVPKAAPAPDPFSLSMRLTYGYNSGWSHLDKWHDMGSARIVDLGKHREDFDSFRQVQIVQVDAPGYRPRNVMRALRETMSFGCRCEHDCCGHFFGGPARIRPLAGNRYAVLMSGHRNV